MINNLRICIINIYFGRFPDWFDIWLNSVRYNREIDFFVVTDQNLSVEIKNLKVIKITFDDFKNLAKEKLGDYIKLNSPYKLCDYKEVYGIILEDEIKQYDYWGECNCDLVFGNLAYFFEKYNLKSFDKFGCRGHLTLYKNTEEVNSRYKLSGGWFGNYKEIFKSNMIWAFDETPGINEIYRKNEFSHMNDIIFADIDVNYNDLRLVEFANDFHKNYDSQLFVWNNGKLLRYYFDENSIKTDEFAYIHLQKRQMVKPEFNPYECDRFIITNNKFIKNNEEINQILINKYNEKDDNVRLEKKFGGEYKKDLRFYWLGRRFLNLKYNIKRIVKNKICIHFKLIGGNICKKK